jgi:hypothetical protein
MAETTVKNPDYFVLVNEDNRLPGSGPYFRRFRKNCKIEKKHDAA